MPRPFISLTTDFGLDNHFVGTMKGVIYSINPDATIIDITHNIPPQDIVQASYVLEAAVKYFPRPTIHVVVVDPGVGGSRKPILAVGEHHYYVAPDNGVLSRVYKTDAVTEVLEITADHYMLKNISNTFHGRDIFAPVAAWLSKTFSAAQFGEPLEEYKTLSYAKPKIVKDRVAMCDVIFIDHFGNIVTNFDKKLFEQALKKFKSNVVRFKVGSTIIKGIRKHYCEVPEKLTPLALFGSMELLEIAVREGNASETLSVKTGDHVYIQFGD